MGLIIGLAAGLGLLLMLLGLTSAPSQKKRLPSRLSRLIDRSGLERVTPGALIGACVGLGLVGGIVVLVVTSVPSAGLIAAIILGSAPILVLRRRARQRGKALRSCWPDAVDLLSSAVKAGLSLPEAVVDLSVRGPEPLRPAFVRFASEYRATGSFDRALSVLTAVLRDPVADRVILALATAREVGGTDLGRVLATLSDFVRQDARSRGDVEARQSWTVNAARVAVAAPWITLLLLCTRPEAVAAYRTPTGTLILVGAAVMSVVAYRVMIAFGRLPDEPRVLR
ncbi:MAG: type II secretion system protein F [Actinobacteria bacterium]|nr:type II secretion system protein F [Actinomycetota bacterium]